LFLEETFSNLIGSALLWRRASVDSEKAGVEKVHLIDRNVLSKA
jgi:hypothetical protein